MMRSLLIILLLSCCLPFLGCKKDTGDPSPKKAPAKTGAKADSVTTEDSADTVKKTASKYRFTRLLRVEGVRQDSVVFDHTGDYILATDRNDVLYCSIPQNRVLWSSDDYASTAAFSLDPNEFIVASDDKTFPLHVFDRNTGKKRGKLKIDVEE